MPVRGLIWCRPPGALADRGPSGVKQRDDARALVCPAKPRRARRLDLAAWGPARELCAPLANREAQIVPPAKRTSYPETRSSSETDAAGTVSGNRTVRIERPSVPISRASVTCQPSGDEPSPSTQTDRRPASQPSGFCPYSATNALSSASGVSRAFVSSPTSTQDSRTNL